MHVERRQGPITGAPTEDPAVREFMGCVLLAERHHGLTEGVRGLLATAFRSVVMVADETSLLDGAGRLQPDVVVVDLSLAQDNNLNWLHALREVACRRQGDCP